MGVAGEPIDRFETRSPLIEHFVVETTACAADGLLGALPTKGNSTSALSFPMMKTGV